MSRCQSSLRSRISLSNCRSTSVPAGNPLIGVEHQSVELFTVERNREVTRIFILLPSGKRLQIWTTLLEPLEWLHATVEDLSGYRAEELVLVLGSARLSSFSSTLGDLGVRPFDKLHLVMRMIGGMPARPLTNNEWEQKLQESQRKNMELQKQLLDVIKANQEDRKQFHAMMDDERKKRRELAEKLDSLQDRMRKSSSRFDREPTNYFKVSNVELDRLRDVAKGRTSRVHMEKWATGLGTRGIRALGRYLQKKNRFDIPSLLLMDPQKLAAINEDQRQAVVVDYLFTKDFRLPTSESLIPHVSEPRSAPVPSSDPFQPPMQQPSPPISQPTTLENQIQKAVQEQMKRYMSTTSTVQGHPLGARQQLMGISPYGLPGVLDASTLSHPQSSQKAMQIVEDFVTGKSKTPFTLQTLRRAVIPGSTSFDIKSRRCTIETFSGLKSALYRLQYDNNKETPKDVDKMIRQIDHAIILISDLQDGKSLAGCVEQWMNGVIYEQSYCGVSFMGDCRIAKNVQTSSSSRRGGSTTTTFPYSCHLCNVKGHLKSNCPYKNGRQIPVDKVCQNFNRGACTTTAAKCDLAHICSHCRVPGATHPVTKCENPNNPSHH